MHTPSELMVEDQLFGFEGAQGLYDALMDPFMIQVSDLLAKMEIFQKGQAASRFLFAIDGLLLRGGLLSQPVGHLFYAYHRISQLD